MSVEGLVDAIHVATVFDMIDRRADSFGLHLPPEEQLGARADAMLQGGYALPTPAALGA